MPGPHARFLEDVAAVASIRSYVTSHMDSFELVTSYDSAVESLREFRNKHIQLVSRYIILPSRMSHQDRNVGRNNLAIASSQVASAPAASQSLVGTGGTKLVPFLRKARDETAAAFVTSQPTA